MRGFFYTAVVVPGLCLLLAPSALARAKPLQIYFIAVEGGQATLIIGLPCPSMRGGTHSTVRT